MQNYCVYNKCLLFWLPFTNSRPAEAEATQTPITDTVEDDIWTPRCEVYSHAVQETGCKVDK